MKKRRTGFTMIELVMTIFLITLVVPLLVKFVGFSYRHFADIQARGMMNTEAKNAVLKMERDINAGGVLTPDVDFQGVKISGPGFEKHYYFKGGSLVVNDGKSEHELIKDKLEGIVFVPGSEVAVVNFVFMKPDLNRHTEEMVKISRNLVMNE